MFSFTLGCWRCALKPFLGINEKLENEKSSFSVRSWGNLELEAARTTKWCVDCCEPSPVVRLVLSPWCSQPSIPMELVLFSTWMTLNCQFVLSVCFLATFSQEVSHLFHWVRRDVACESCLFPHSPHIAPCLPSHHRNGLIHSLIVLQS